MKQVVVIIIFVACSLFGCTAISPTPTRLPTMTLTFAATQTRTLTSPPEPTSTLTSTPRPTSTPTATATSTNTPTATPTLGIGSTKISPIDGATMMYVPAGEFTMGGNDYDNEKPPHPVYLDAFWIDKFEVTNALYRKCVDAKQCRPPDSTKSSTRDTYYGEAWFDNYPVIYVSWDDATRYCTWAGKKLPTEAQWEKAASWDDARKEKRIYPWGNDVPNCQRANYWGKSDGCVGDTAVVGNYPLGASPCGAMDMAGNVWEWVRDWYADQYYASSPKNNPENTTPASSRVVRGGAWTSQPPRPLRAATRDSEIANERTMNLGFRCVE